MNEPIEINPEAVAAVTDEQRAICQRLEADVMAGINALRTLKRDVPGLRNGFYTASPGSLLNAYREGDIGFDDTVGWLSKLPKPEPTQKDHPMTERTPEEAKAAVLEMFPDAGVLSLDRLRQIVGDVQRDSGRALSAFCESQDEAWIDAAKKWCGQPVEDLESLRRKAAMFDWLTSQEYIALIHTPTGCVFQTQELETHKSPTITGAIELAMNPASKPKPLSK